MIDWVAVPTVLFYHYMLTELVCSDDREFYPSCCYSSHNHLFFWVNSRQLTDMAHGMYPLDVILVESAVEPGW